MIVERVRIRGEEEKSRRRFSYTRRRLESLIKEIDGELERLRESNTPKTIAYNYVVLKRILQEIYGYVRAGKPVNTKSTYILPGAIWIAKNLVHGRMSIHEAASCIDRTRYLAVQMFRTLVYERKLSLIIPSNLSPEDVKVYIWADKAGYDREGNPVYVLTMYFSFPFDINELDKRSEYEPVAFLFIKKGKRYVPVKAFARVHYDLYVYDISGVGDIKILFTRTGHTPKILSGRIVERVSNSNVLKELVDKAWLVVGDLSTRLTGVQEVRVRDSPDKVHVYIGYKLPQTRNNPFTALVHPYFVDISFP